MFNLDEKDIPAGRGKVVDGKNVELRGATTLAKGAVVEFPQIELVEQVENPNNADRPFTNILVVVNGRGRYIPTGTFTQRDWLGSGTFVSPEVGRDAAQFGTAHDLYEGMKDKKMKVVDICRTKRQVYKDGVRTDATEPVNYPIFEYVD